MRYIRSPVCSLMCLFLVWSESASNEYILALWCFRDSVVAHKLALNDILQLVNDINTKVSTWFCLGNCKAH